MFRSVISFIALALSVVFGQLLCTTVCSQQVVVEAESVQAEQKWPDNVAVDREFDFGRVLVGQAKEHRFKLTNNTAGPLKIGSIATSCGCMEATINGKVLAVGATTELIVVPRTKNYRGKKTASIHVRFRSPLDEIKFSAAVEISNFSVSREKIRFFEVQDGTTQSIEFQIQHLNDASWTIEKVSSSSSNLTVAIVKPLENQPPGQRTLVCTFNSLSGAALQREEQLVIRTSDLREPKIVVPVEICAATKPLQCSVEQLTFTPDDLLAATGKSFFVLTAEPSELKSLEFNSVGFVARELESGRKKTHVIEIQPVERLETAGNKLLKQSVAGENEGKVVSTLKIQTQAGLACEVRLAIVNPATGAAAIKKPNKEKSDSKPQVQLRQ